MKIKETLALEFNNFSKNYTDDMIGCVPYYLELLSCFSSCLPDNYNPTSILDLGCGNGNVSAELMTCFPTASYTLVDASTEMIDICRHRFSDYDITYLINYFKDVAYPVESYDLSVAGFSLHHCDDEEKQSIFNKVYASLRQGGIFSCSDLMISKSNPDHPQLLKKWESFVNQSFRDGEKWTWLMEHYEAFDKPSDYTMQLDWLKQAGFSDVKILFQEEYWIHFQAVK